MIIIGADPGLTGSIAILGQGRGLLDCLDLPTCRNGTATGKMLTWLDVGALRAQLAERIERFGVADSPVLCCIERPIPMPTLPAQTIASQFDTFGALRALLQAIGPTEFVLPKEWKGFFGLRQEKTPSRECALRLYPTAPVDRVKDHNRAEAILIAHWLLRRHCSGASAPREDLMGAF